MPRISTTVAKDVAITGRYFAAQKGDWFTPPVPSYVDPDSIDIEGDLLAVGDYILLHVNLPADMESWTVFRAGLMEILHEAGDAQHSAGDI